MKGGKNPLETPQGQPPPPPLPPRPSPSQTPTGGREQQQLGAEHRDAVIAAHGMRPEGRKPPNVTVAVRSETQWFPTLLPFGYIRSLPLLLLIFIYTAHVLCSIYAPGFSQL